MLARTDTLAAIRDALPKEVLFAEKDWLLSPDAFPIERKFLTELEQLGHRLFVFQRVIRPDLIVTDNGYIIAEIDSVPGGIGLTAWLNQTYSAFDKQIVGGANGMLEGFQSVLPNGGDIVISQEASMSPPFGSTL